MRSLVVAGFLALSALASAFPVFEATPAAQACSCPGCDPIGDAETILSGTILGWERTGEPGRSPQSIPIRVSIAVDRVHKGYAAAVVSFDDPSSLENLTDPARPDLPEKLIWLGGSGGCQTFDYDPTGKYAVLAFDSAATWPRAFFIGNEGDPRHGEAGTMLRERLGPPYPPAAGNTAFRTADPSSDWLWLSAIGGGLLLFTLVLLLIGPRDDRR